MISDFSDKPKTEAMCLVVDQFVSSLGDLKKELKSQVSYSINRKFLWMWSYEKTSDGVLYLTVCLDEELKSPNFHYVNKVNPNRWNHHVVLKDISSAKSDWLRSLLKAGFNFASK